MLEIPEFEDDRWRATWTNLQAPFNYERSIENGLDPAHNEFVHPIHGYSGENAEYKVGNLRRVGDGKWGPGFFHKFKSPSAETDEWKQMKEASDSREAGTGTIGPNHMWTYIRYAPGKAMHQYIYECPIDEGNVNIFLVNMRNQLIDPDRDQMVNERNWTIISQDLVVLSKLNPTVTPPTNTKEFMVPADVPILAYREKLAEWNNNGWRIDSDTVDRNRKKVAYAIPSPARRHHKGWVIDPIPLLPATTVAKRQIQSAS
jgi:phenylpropionate dioxygenase-like ring-hydroxylating dioxygenase large terminal subunit